MSMFETSTARALLAERARALSRPLEAVPTGEELVLVAFLSGSEAFCIEASYVREVARLRRLVAVPGAPPAVRGVTTYRGEIIATVDVAAVLTGRADGLADLLWTIVLGEDAPEFGLLADTISGTLRVRLAELRPLPGEASPVMRRLVRGLTADAAVVLDGRALLTDPTLFTARPPAIEHAPPAKGREGSGTDATH